VFAGAMGRPSRVAADAIDAVPSSAYPTPAARPMNSRLDTARLRATFDLELPPWRAGVDRLLTEILS
jgi:dTDP-4-dehydrorhamnose reductase